MSDGDLLAELQTLVEEEDAAALLDFVKAQNWHAVDQETIAETLKLIGLYGFSGRTSRYESSIREIVDSGVEISLHSFVLLHLNDEAEALLKNSDAEIGELAIDGGNLLHAAAERGNLELARSLVQSGLEVNHSDNSGETPIHRALHAGPWKNSRAMDVAELLLDNGARVDLRTLAALGYGERVAAFLQEEPATLNERDTSGATALYHACHNNRTETVKRLLALGADPNVENADGETPLSTACLHTQSQECDVEIIEALVASGAQPTLESAVVLSDLDLIRRFLSAQNGERHEHSRTLDSAYNTAIHGWFPESLKLLIELGRSPTETEWGHIERICGADPVLWTELKELGSR